MASNTDIVSVLLLSLLCSGTYSQTTSANIETTNQLSTELKTTSSTEMPTTITAEITEVQTTTNKPKTTSIITELPTRTTKLPIETTTSSIFTTEVPTTTKKPIDHTQKPCIGVNYGHSSIVCVCNSTYCDTIPPIEMQPEGEYEIYTSDRSGSRFLKTKGIFLQNFKKDSPSNGLVYINTDITYQTILGFGSTFTDASGTNIDMLDDATKENLLKSYFSTDGIEYNLGHIPFGCTDFSSSPYTYDDGTEDPQLKKFKLAKEDTKIKIPLIKETQKLQNDLLLLGTSWGAPAWMKNTGEITGPGLLKPDMYQSWAEYHLRILDAFKTNGLSFWGITTGNEPTNNKISSQVPSVSWLGAQMGLWINKHLGPTISTSDFSSTKILAVNDHWSQFPKFIDLMYIGNPSAANYIHGYGVHWQDDNKTPAKVLSDTHSKYPKQILLSTSAVAGANKPNGNLELGKWEHAESYARAIIESLNNWATGWMDYNLALDTSGGPTFVVNNNKEAAIVVNPETKEFYKQPIFYVQGHFSKFISRNSKRIAVTKLFTDVETAAFKRPDGVIVAVLYNNKISEQNVRINDIRRGYINVILPARSISTILYA